MILMRYLAISGDVNYVKEITPSGRGEFHEARDGGRLKIVDHHNLRRLVQR